MAAALTASNAVASRTFRPISIIECAAEHAGASLAIDPAPASLINHTGIV
jgi:hypothetical protein